jgi:GTP-binding protein HflX
MLDKSRGKRAMAPSGHSASLRSPQARLGEAIGLAAAIDLDVKASGLVPVPNPQPATLFGSGKVEELKGLVRAEEAGHAGTAAQPRNGVEHEGARPHRSHP